MVQGYLGRLSSVVGFINPGSLEDRLPRPGSAQEKQHVVHRPAQEPKNTTGQKGSLVADRKVYPKEQAPARQLLRPTSPTGALASGTSRLKRSLQSEGLVQNAASYSDPATTTPRPGLVGTLLTALLRPAH